MRSARVLAFVLSLGCARVAQSQVEVETFVSGLDQPVCVTHPRDGSNRLFIAEQPGAIRVLQPGTRTPQPFLDIRSKVLSGGEQGLLGLAFHPAFRDNGRFFVNYTRRPDGATVIAEYRTAPGNPNAADLSESVLLVIGQPFANHNGGMLEFGPDGYLYIAVGDGGAGNDPGNRAQDPADLLGKILRIDVDRAEPGKAYSSPPDNPFAGVANARPEIYAVGLRNPWRFSFDRVTGSLYAGDVGQNQVEEVDVITRGGNYGWRIFEGTRCTGLGPASCDAPGFTGPIAEYTHDGRRCSVTGGYVYRGSKGTLPAGAYVYGDFCSGEIFLHNGGRSALILDTQINISSFGEDEAGEIYVTGLTDGTIYRITNAAGAATDSAIIFPALSSSGVERTGFAIVNFDAAPANLVLTARDASGNVISGSGITNPRDLVLESRVQLALLDSEIFGAGLEGRSSPGWVSVDSSSDQVAAFFLNFDPSLRSLDGADALAATLSSFVLPEIEPGGFTRMHIANPATDPVSVTLQLRGEGGGVRTATTRQIPPRGTLSEELTTLFPGTAVAASDYLTGQAATGVAVFGLLGLQGRDTRGLNGQNASGGSGTLYAPQYVAGPVRSILTVINLDDREGVVTLRFHREDGTPHGSMREVTAGPRAKVVIDTPDFFGNLGPGLVQGYLLVSSTTLRLAGSIQFADPLRNLFSTSLPLVSSPRNRLVFSQVAINSTYFTGLALLNPGDSATNAQVEVFDPSGTRLASGSVRLPARGSASRLLTEFFPALAGRTVNSGYITVDADQPLAGFALFGTSDLAVLSAIPAQHLPD
jgi:hypothetical protein